MRRILFLSLSLCLISFFSRAQIKKGDVQLGGAFSFRNTESSSSFPNSEKFRQVSIMPSLGLAIKENTVIGIRGLTGKFSHRNSPNTFETRKYGAGIFYRKYVPLSQRFYLFGDGGIDFTRWKSESNYSGSITKTKTTSVGASLFPGVTYALGKRFLLEATLNNLVNLSYTSNRQESSPGSVSKSNTLSLNLNANPVNNLGVGLKIIF